MITDSFQFAQLTDYEYGQSEKKTNEILISVYA